MSVCRRAANHVYLTIVLITYLVFSRATAIAPVSASSHNESSLDGVRAAASDEKGSSSNASNSAPWHLSLSLSGSGPTTAVPGHVHALGNAPIAPAEAERQAAVANAAVNAAGVAADEAPVLSHGRTASAVPHQPPPEAEQSSGHVAGEAAAAAEEVDPASVAKTGAGSMAAGILGAPLGGNADVQGEGKGYGINSGAPNDHPQHQPLAPRAPQSAEEFSGAKSDAASSGAGASGDGQHPDAAEGNSNEDALNCDDGPCFKLGETLLEVVEGPSCRLLLLTGRCPKACATALTEITDNSLWPTCATTCRKDIVEGAAERWTEMCSKHAETFLDQGKDVVKKIVGNNSVSGGGNPFVSIFLGTSAVILALFVGYSRGSSAARRAYRAQRRNRLARKLSDPEMRRKPLAKDPSAFV